ncbi:MAG: aldose epimerase family protein [Acidobacteriaceae bacterium]
MLIGGKAPITLNRLQTGDDTLPEFLSATILPGRGMNVLQIQAYIPGRGVTNLLASPTLEEADKLLTGTGDDAYGAKSYSFGGAFLIPYPNRIRGKLSADGNSVTTYWHDHAITLPANLNAHTSGKEAVAMHGLILKSDMDDVKISTLPDGQVVNASYHAGNFGGHWPSQTDLSISMVLTGHAFDATIKATNVGNEPEPMAIGWHPYFAIPSGERAHATLHLPPSMRAEIDNYQNVFPTGRILPVTGTPYDFTRRGGAPLGNTYLDDDFVNLNPSVFDLGPIVELRDPAAGYGLRLTALSPEIKSIQVYSPPDKKFVAIEPQFNHADPFGKEWKGQDTGMVTLNPGDSVTWKVRLELFIPVSTMNTTK